VRFRVELPVLGISVFQETHFLPEVAVDRLDTTFTTTIIDTNLHVNYLIPKVQDLRNLCLNVQIHNRLQTAEAPLILHLALKLKVLMRQSFDTLTFDILYFLKTLLLLKFSFLLLDIGNSLTLQ
jgi:hypothetical protein